MQEDNVMISIIRAPIGDWLLNRDGNVAIDVGIVLKDWKRFSPDHECHLHFLDVLVDGQRKRYYRAIPDNLYSSYVGIDGMGMWEQADGSKSGHCIRKISD